MTADLRHLYALRDDEEPQLRVPAPVFVLAGPAHREGRRHGPHLIREEDRVCQGKTD